MHTTSIIDTILCIAADIAIAALIVFVVVEVLTGAFARAMDDAHYRKLRELRQQEINRERQRATLIRITHHQQESKP